MDVEEETSEFIAAACVQAAVERAVYRLTAAKSQGHLGVIASFTDNKRSTPLLLPARCRGPLKADNAHVGILSG
jgi:hypothetical protein